MPVESVHLISNAILERTEPGEIVIRFRGLVYKADDALPADISATLLEHGRSDARSFIRTLMVRDYGRFKKNWPALAREFLTPK